MTPSVQKSSIQHRIVSLYLLGWNSPRYGKQIPIAPVILQQNPNSETIQRSAVEFLRETVEKSQQHEHNVALNDAGNQPDDTVH